ncbi:M1 family metallopeptidase [Cuniculiplasma sp. SKW4]|uniref:M1 family metallopeptidase n=1 Tax=Cuniculiplasma sp. SKW4 TaxID=3400171 RepID=UPI003FD4456F
MMENKADFQSYDLEMEIDEREKTIKGEVRINLENRAEKLYLDMDEIEVNSLEIDGKSSDFKVLNDGKILEIQTGTGRRAVTLKYKGKVNEKLSGLYEAKYKGGSILTTQFESTGARRVFPCADNPSSKAIFHITLIINSELEAISNMPVESEKVRPDGKKIVKFMETPRMSTYLIYLGIGNFSTKEGESGRTKIILTAPRGHLTDSDFPIEITSEVLKRFNGYFQIDYVLPKVHIISVPEFAAGAMENWGAITFREIYLNIDKSTSLSTYKATAEVIAHELAHQWFGNLVTMKWWNDLWLNESFATFMSYKVIQEIKGKWNPVGDQIFLRTEGALKNDSFELTHPIDAKVNDPSEIAEIFDEISYGKGSSILRMIETYMGEENFRKGIVSYLSRFKYSNAEGKDLWKSLEEESGMEVSKIMEAWIRKEGYPIIQAQLSGDKVKLKQGRFYGTGKIDFQNIWPVPMVIKRKNQYESILLEKGEEEIDARDIVSFNGKSAGFYRVFLSGELSNHVLANSKMMNEFEAYNFLSDNFAMFSAGHIDFVQYDERMGSLWDREEPLVIREISRELDLLFTLSRGGNIIGKRIEDFYQKHRNMKSEDPEDPNVKIAYNGMLALYSRAGEGYRRELASKFERFLDEEPEARAMIGRAYAAEDGKAEKIIEIMEKAKNDEDRVKLIAALGSLKRREELEIGFEFVMKGGIKKQDLPSYFLSLGTNIYHREFFNKSFNGIMGKLESVFEASRTTTRTVENTLPFTTLEDDHILEEIGSAPEMAKYEKTMKRVREIRKIYQNVAKSISQ